jgi:ubiquinone/menaquinone biosynthesis C-methylase UbiE
MNEIDEVTGQRRYYEETAERYDSVHVPTDVEHILACQLVRAFLEPRYPSASILDIGAGTGRLHQFLKGPGARSDFDVLGIEPSDALRAIAHRQGVPEDKHIEGNATKLDFPDGSFDFSSSIGVLHHIKDCRQAVHEMCRVASRGIWLSDSNKYGQGSLPLRVVKQVLRHTRMWEAMDFVRTRGRCYHYSEGDGVYYSFSALDVIDIIQQKFPFVYAWPTRPVTSPNLYMGCSHVLVLAHC